VAEDLQFQSASVPVGRTSSQRRDGADKPGSARVPGSGSQSCERGIEPAQQHSILAELAVTALDEIRDVHFALEPERGCEA